MKIKHWLIPNKKNKFHPIVLQPIGLVIFSAVFVALPVVYNLIAVKQFKVLGYATNVTVSDVYSISNQQRLENGLPPLSLDPLLSSAAQAKAQDMMTDNYWAHIAPDGTSPWYFITSVGYQYSSAGENLAKGFNLSSGVVNGWMESPTHRANVLNQSYKDVGYAVLNGTLLGSQTTLVVAMYGAKIETAVVASIDQVPTVQNQTNQMEPSSTQQPEAPIKTGDTTTSEAPVSNTDNNTTKIQDINTKKNSPTSERPSSGEVEGIASASPVRAYNSLNWGQKVSVLLISTLILLFAMKHTLIWREKRSGYKHIWLRAHPVGQIAILIVVLAATLVSGVGVVL